jgi:hypothetical protein
MHGRVLWKATELHTEQWHGTWRISWYGDPDNIVATADNGGLYLVQHTLREEARAILGDAQLRYDAEMDRIYSLSTERDEDWYDHSHREADDRLCDITAKWLAAYGWDLLITRVDLDGNVLWRKLLSEHARAGFILAGDNCLIVYVYREQELQEDPGCGDTLVYFLGKNGEVQRVASGVWQSVPCYCGAITNDLFVHTTVDPFAPLDRMTNSIEAYDLVTFKRVFSQDTGEFLHCRRTRGAHFENCAVVGDGIYFSTVTSVIRFDLTTLSVKVFPLLNLGLSCVGNFLAVDTPCAHVTDEDIVRRMRGSNHNLRWGGTLLLCDAHLNVVRSVQYPEQLANTKYRTMNTQNGLLVVDTTNQAMLVDSDGDSCYFGHEPYLLERQAISL